METKTTAQLLIERKAMSATVIAKGWEWARFSLISIDAELTRRGVTA